MAFPLCGCLGRGEPTSLFAADRGSEPCCRPLTLTFGLWFLVCNAVVWWRGNRLWRRGCLVGCASKQHQGSLYGLWQPAPVVLKQFDETLQVRWIFARSRSAVRIRPPPSLPSTTFAYLPIPTNNMKRNPKIVFDTTHPTRYIYLKFRKHRFSEFMPDFISPLQLASFLVPLIYEHANG